MRTLRQDLGFAVRTLVKTPVFTAVAILSLALGIGVNTALFSFMDRLLIRSLPVHDPALLTLLESPGPTAGYVMNAQAFSYPAYKDICDRNDVFSGVLARYETPVSLSWRSNNELASGELVSGNYFDVLGLKPYVGRLFTQADDRVPGAHRVAVLSYGYWNRKFGADRGIAGQKVLLNGQPFEIVGVAPPRFEGVLIGTQIEVFVPMMMKGLITPTWNGLDDRRTWFVNIFARLKPGVTAQQARDRLAPLQQQMLQSDLAVIGTGNENFRQRFLAKKLLVRPGYQGRSFLRTRMRIPLIVLMSMVGLVLLIACANLANLLIARAASRQKEIAIRLSLGASRGALVRQLFTESAVLALAGGTLGVLVSVWAGDLLLSLSPGMDSGPGVPDWSMPDGRILLFNFAVSVLTALLFGLVPAWKATRTAVATTLKDQAGSVSSSLGDVRLRKGLVVAQIALSLLLLFGASLFARSLHNLRSLDPGFQTENLLTFAIDPSLSGYQQTNARAVLEQVRTSIAALPGVRGVAMSDNPLLAGNVFQVTVNIEGYQRKDGESMNPDFANVSPGFFHALGIPIIAGREFTDTDAAGGQKTVIINSAFAKRFFDKQNPLGRRVGMGDDKPEYVIVGVVGDLRNRSLREEQTPMYFFPYLLNSNPGAYTYYVRASGNPAGLATSIRQEVAKAAGTVPVYEMRSMESQVDRILSVERAFATMSAFFGLLAAVLAAIGLYGVMAYNVARRTREIGIRVALGAERSAVLWLVLKEVAIMAALGIAIGAPAALALSRYVHSQLYGLTPNDPVTLASAVGAMIMVALLAGFVPANRASRVDPVRALRYE